MASKHAGMQNQWQRCGQFAGTCILFGDGCGAIVMTAQEGPCALLGSSMCSDGLGQKHLKVASHPPQPAQLYIWLSNCVELQPGMRGLHTLLQWRMAGLRRRRRWSFLLLMSTEGSSCGSMHVTVHCNCGSMHVTVHCNCGSMHVTVRCNCGSMHVTVRCNCGSMHVTVHCNSLGCWLQALYCGEGMKPLHQTHASAKGSFDNIFMNGQEVFKFAVRAVPSVSAKSSIVITRESVTQCQLCV